jgi:mannose-1-phosphate guanylyltransferase
MPDHGPVYAFIMAGGIGTRLWPRSRKHTPKQFLDLVSTETMLQDAYQRLLPVIPAERIMVGVGEEYVSAVHEQLPDLPRQNVVVEPSGRGTAPAIGLGALHIHRRSPEAIMAVTTADHHIGNAKLFRHLLSAAAAAAQEGRLITLGITPTFASTGYGYIRRGELLQTIDEFDVYRAIRFTEKPDATMAQAFMDSGLYSWNSGMFIWQAETIRHEFERQMPRLWSQLVEIERALGTPDEQAVIERIWANVEKQTIDYGIMEHAHDVAVIPACIGWNDVGSWKTLMALLERNDHGNIEIGKHLTLDTNNTLIYSPTKLVATIGLQDIIIVETPDALLVCSQDRCQDVRSIVQMLRDQGKQDLL